MWTDKPVGPPVLFPKTGVQINCFPYAQMFFESLLTGYYQNKFQSIEEILEHGIDWDAQEAYYEEVHKGKYNVSNAKKAYQAFLLDLIEGQRDSHHIADLFFQGEDEEPNIRPEKPKKTKNTGKSLDFDDLF